MKVSILGSGNMGSALAQALIRKGLQKPAEVTMIDVNQAKLDQLKKKLKVKTSTKVTAVLESELIILAVKPQSFAEAAKHLKGKLSSSTIILSIMAGVTIAKINQELDHARVARAMPNTPAMVEAGVSGWFAPTPCTDKNRKTVKKILDSCGFSIEVEQESHLDAITALSGSGPGFFFFILNDWMTATKQLPFPPEVSKILLLRTLEGSLTLAHQSSHSFAELRDQVTSKGGTTEAGLKELKKAKLDKHFSAMLKASQKRCQQLNS